MKQSRLALCVLALAATTAVMPSFAAAHSRYHHYRHYRHYSDTRHDSGCHQRHSTNGTIIGAVGGGIVGGSMAHGNALPAAALGAGVGALAGHAIGARSGC